MRSAQFMRLPWPPSVNKIWRSSGNGTLLSKVGRYYRKAAVSHILETCGGEPEPLLGRLTVVIEMFPPDRRKRDIDNHAKAVLDALTLARVIGDDSQIDELRLVRRDVSKGHGFVLVEVAEYEDIASQG